MPRSESQRPKKRLPEALRPRPRIGPPRRTMMSSRVKTLGSRIKPLDDRIVILPDEPESETTGGILLPAAAQELTMRGTVVAAGPGKTLDNGQRGDLGVVV